MGNLRIVLFLVIGAAAVVLFRHLYAPIHAPLPVIVPPVSAQAPATATIQVKQLPNTSTEDPWHRFELMVPPTNPPLDIHAGLLVDGKGSETTSEQPHAWSQPLLFQYRLDNDDDGRVKDILEAQGLPVKRNLITYRFAAGTGGWTGYPVTIRFKHGPGSAGMFEGCNVDRATIGQKVVLDNRLISDTDFKGDLNKIGDWSQPAFAPNLPPGMVHHLVVYLMFQPHQGPPVRGNESIGRSVDLTTKQR